jgi:predicted Rossmann fold flavoprotein
VPSLFTFKVDDPRLRDLAGVSVPLARVRLAGAKEAHEGPLLVTHWGLSGPAVLKASAWGARLLHDAGYRLGVSVDWRPDLTEEDVRDALADAKVRDARRTVHAAGPFGLPQRLWRSLAGAAGATETVRWADVSKPTLQALTREVHAGGFQVGGKGVFKEEFVSCGGVRLNEVDFATMESRVRPGLHFAGEVLDIDGITGGFNFQSAWTTGWLAGRALAR